MFCLAFGSTLHFAPHLDALALYLALHLALHLDAFGTVLSYTTTQTFTAPCCRLNLQVIKQLARWAVDACSMHYVNNMPVDGLLASGRWPHAEGVRGKALYADRLCIPVAHADKDTIIKLAYPWVVTLAQEVAEVRPCSPQPQAVTLLCCTAGRIHRHRHHIHPCPCKANIHLHLLCCMQLAQRGVTDAPSARAVLTNVCYFALVGWQDMVHCRW